MESGSSLPNSPEPATCPYPEPDQSNTRHPFLMFEDPSIRFTPGCSAWGFSFTFPHQNLVCISVLPIHATGPVISSTFQLGIQIMKLFIMHFFHPLLPSSFVPLNTLFSNTVSFSSFLNVSDWV